MFVPLALCHDVLIPRCGHLNETCFGRYSGFLCWKKRLVQPHRACEGCSNIMGITIIFRSHGWVKMQTIDLRLKGLILYYLYAHISLSSNALYTTTGQSIFLQLLLWFFTVVFSLITVPFIVYIYNVHPLKILLCIFFSIISLMPTGYFHFLPPLRSKLPREWSRCYPHPLSSTP